MLENAVKSQAMKVRVLLGSICAVVVISLDIHSYQYRFVGEKVGVGGSCFLVLYSVHVD